MASEKIFSLSFAKVYPCLIAKAQRKGRTKEEVLFLTEWLTGYSGEEIEAALSSDLTYGDFFRSAPAMHPSRGLINGSICGIRLDAIEDPLMKDIRILDKLVDDLAKGKPMEKILPKE